MIYIKNAITMSTQMSEPSVKNLLTGLKETVCSAIDDATGDLKEISAEIWNNPELAFDEHFAHKLLTDFFKRKGFDVRPSFKLETAFQAVYDTQGDGPNIAVLCEYDALPGIGHACGHNLIAEVGVGAALGIQAALKASGTPLGKLTVLGTPAEEGKCGKADLIRLGAFEGIDVAMMAHPSQCTLAKPNFVSMSTVSIKYFGKAAHAAAFPWDGVNALDAAVMCYNNISCLRQQMKPTWRVHGVITNGGSQPNITPEETELLYFVRAPTDTELQVLKEKVVGCINGAALSTGCKVEFAFSEKSYSNLISNNCLAELFTQNASQVGVEFETNEEKKRRFGGSTDMGNVSHVVPSIHPKFHIGTYASNHSKEFTVAAGDPIAQPYTLNIAKGIAMVAMDIYTNPVLLKDVKQEFEDALKNEIV